MPEIFVDLQGKEWQIIEGRLKSAIDPDSYFRLVIRHEENDQTIQKIVSEAFIKVCQRSQHQNEGTSQTG